MIRRRFVAVAVLILCVRLVYAESDEDRIPPPKIPLSANQQAEQLAQSAITLGRLADVEPALRNLVEKYPSSSLSHYWLAMAQKQRGDLLQAIEHLKSSVHLEPANITARLDYAQLLSEARYNKNSIEQLKFLILQEPRHLLARSFLASLYLRQSQLDEAIEQYSIVKSLSDKHPKSREADSSLQLLYIKKATLLAQDLGTEEGVDDALHAADLWIEQKHFDPALWLLQKIRDAYPSQARTNFLIGYIYSQTAQLRTALPYLRDAANSVPKQIRYLDHYAQTLARTGQLEEAENTLKEVIALTSDKNIQRVTQQRVDLVIGERYLRDKQPEKALEHYLKMLHTDANNLALLHRISDIYVSLGETDSASEIVERIRRTETQRRRNQNLLAEARALSDKGQSQRAAFKLQLLLQEDPGNSQAFYWLAAIYSKERDFPEAIKNMQLAIAFSPENSELRKEFARLLVHSGKLQEAISTYQQLASNQDDPKKRKEFLRLAQFVVGQHLLNSGRHRAALEHYQLMSLQFPDDISVLEALASIYVSQNLLEEARETYLLALQRDPERALTHLRLAAVYTKMQDDEKRRHHYSQAIYLDLNGHVGQTALDNLLSNGKNAQQANAHAFALHEFQAILSVRPNHELAATAAALSAQHVGHPELAKSYYERVIHNAPANTRIRIEYARLLVRMDQLTHAISEFETITQISPNSITAREANANLDILYNSHAKDLLKPLDAPEQYSATELQTIVDGLVETARNWTQEQNRILAAQNILMKVVERYEQNEKAHYWLGNIYDRQRNFDPALAHIGRSIALAPENLQLRAAYGRVLARAGNLTAAEALYRDIIRFSPNTLLGRETEKLLGFIVGQRLIQEGKLGEALTHYQTMQKDAPYDVAIKARIANVYLNQKDYERARATFEEVLKEQPNSPSVHMQLAQLYEQTGDKEAQTRTLRKVIELDPKGALGLQALNTLGLSEGNRLLLQKRWEEAIVVFEGLLTIEPNNANANLGIATAYLESGSYELAWPVLEKIIRTDPANMEARLKLARIMVTTKNLDEAVLELERIVAATPGTLIGREALLNLTNIYRERGASLLRQGYGDAAVVEYQKAIAKDPDDWRANYELGKIFQSASQTTTAENQRKFLEIAIGHYKEAVRVNPNHYNAYLNMASIYEVLTVYIEAQQAFAYALAYLEDENETLQNMLRNAIRVQAVREEFARGNLEWVIFELTDMLEYEPSNVRLHLFLSTVYIRQEEIELAIKELKISVDLIPENVSARYRLAQLYEQNSDLELAADQYRGILFSSQRGTIVEAAREQLLRVEERLRLLSFRLQYSSAYSRSTVEGVTDPDLAGTALASTTTSNSFSSSLRFEMAANVRPTKYLNLTFNASPSYSTFHTAENDAWAPLIGFTGHYNFRKGFVSANVNHLETKGLLLEDSRGLERNANLTIGRQLRIPLFFSEQGAMTPGSLQFRLSLREFHADDTTFYNIHSFGANTTFTHSFRTGGALRLNYGYTDTQPDLEYAADYASLAHNASITINRPLATRLFGVISAGASYEFYKNGDSNAPTRKRHTGRINLSIGLNYQLHRKLSLFMDFSGVEQRTNLPRGAIRANDENRTIVGIQGGSLGDYRSAGINGGMQFQF